MTSAHNGRRAIDVGPQLRRDQTWSPSGQTGGIQMPQYRMIMEMFQHQTNKHA
jgi:hypothetical protein